jgi:hypothetical protein
MRRDRFEIVDREREFGLARHGQEMQYRVGRAGRSGHTRYGIVEGGTRADIARQDVVAHRVHDDFAAAERYGVLPLVHLRDSGGAHRGEADQFHYGGHCVGGELAAARTRAGAGVVFDIEQVCVAQLAARVGADGFEDVLNGDVVAFEFSGHDGAA